MYLTRKLNALLEVLTVNYLLNNVLALEVFFLNSGTSK